jgi:hemolysin III
MRKLLFEHENEPMSGLTHFLGFLLVIAGLVLLIVFAAKRGTVWHIVGYTVFGASMILLYLASTIYHFIPITHRAKAVMQRIDHAMIYVLIAGTYTPICFVTLRGGWGWSLFGVIWGLAILGIVWKAVGKWQNAAVSIILYLVMGWLVSIAFVPLMRGLPEGGFGWLLAGGLCYTVGAVAFGLSHIKFHPRWFGMHELWHVFVMAGSFCHFWLLLTVVL